MGFLFVCFSLCIIHFAWMLDIPWRTIEIEVSSVYAWKTGVLLLSGSVGSWPRSKYSYYHRDVQWIRHQIPLAVGCLYLVFSMGAGLPEGFAHRFCSCLPCSHLCMLALQRGIPSPCLYLSLPQLFTAPAYSLIAWLLERDGAFSTPGGGWGFLSTLSILPPPMVIRLLPPNLCSVLCCARSSSAQEGFLPPGEVEVFLSTISPTIMNL